MTLKVIFQTFTEYIQTFGNMELDSLDRDSEMLGYGFIIFLFDISLIKNFTSPLGQCLDSLVYDPFDFTAE